MTITAQARRTLRESDGHISAGVSRARPNARLDPRRIQLRGRLFVANSVAVGGGRSQTGHLRAAHRDRTGHGAAGLW